MAEVLITTYRGSTVPSVRVFVAVSSCSRSPRTGAFTHRQTTAATRTCAPRLPQVLWKPVSLVIRACC
ncbi:unnamed protein product [Knipowitschia caucasica]